MIDQYNKFTFQTITKYKILDACLLTNDRVGFYIVDKCLMHVYVPLPI